MTDQWFLADSEQIDLNRIDTTLGLRASIRYYNDLVAPGIGNVGFIRQLTWSCLAIHYSKQLDQRAIKLGNAIEALGLKAFYHCAGKEIFNERGFRGSRAFNRTSYREENSFEELSNQKNYVQIRYRQNTSRTLRPETGLGLVDETGTGYESFRLSASGVELLEEHQRHFENIDLKKTLSTWISGGSIPADKANERFGPISTKNERLVILRRLNSEIDKKFPGIREDLSRRRVLISLFPHFKEGWGISELQEICKKNKLNLYLEDFNKAVDFYEMLQAGQKVLAKIYFLLEANNGKLDLKTKDVAGEILELIRRCKTFLLLHSESMSLEAESTKFAKYICDMEGTNERILQEIANRDKRVCLPMGDSIVKGPLFRSGALDADKLVVSVPYSLRNLYSLWSECAG